MDKEVIEIAKDVFRATYGVNPREWGYSEIDIDERRKVFVYAASIKILQAYHRRQTISRWLLIFSPLLPIILGLWLFLSKACSASPLIIVTYVLLFWVVLLCFILGLKASRNTQKIRFLKYGI